MNAIQLLRQKNLDPPSDEDPYPKAYNSTIGAQPVYKVEIYQSDVPQLSDVRDMLVWSADMIDCVLDDAKWQSLYNFFDWEGVSSQRFKSFRFTRDTLQQQLISSYNHWDQSIFKNIGVSFLTHNLEQLSSNMGWQLHIKQDQNKQKWAKQFTHCEALRDLLEQDADEFRLQLIESLTEYSTNSMFLFQSGQSETTLDKFLYTGSNSKIKMTCALIYITFDQEAVEHARDRDLWSQNWGQTTKNYQMLQKWAKTNLRLASILHDIEIVRQKVLFSRESWEDFLLNGLQTDEIIEMYYGCETVSQWNKMMQKEKMSKLIDAIFKDQPGTSVADKMYYVFTVTHEHNEANMFLFTKLTQNGATFMPEVILSSYDGEVWAKILSQDFMKYIKQDSNYETKNLLQNDEKSREIFMNAKLKVQTVTQLTALLQQMRNNEQHQNINNEIVSILQGNFLMIHYYEKIPKLIEQYFHYHDQQHDKINLNQVDIETNNFYFVKKAKMMLVINKNILENVQNKNIWKQYLQVQSNCTYFTKNPFLSQFKIEEIRLMILDAFLVWKKQIWSEFNHNNFEFLIELFSDTELWTEYMKNDQIVKQWTKIISTNPFIDKTNIVIQRWTTNENKSSKEIELLRQSQLLSIMQYISKFEFIFDQDTKQFDLNISDTDNQFLFTFQVILAAQSKRIWKQFITSKEIMKQLSRLKSQLLKKINEDEQCRQIFIKEQISSQIWSIAKQLLQKYNSNELWASMQQSDINILIEILGSDFLIQHSFKHIRTLLTSYGQRNYLLPPDFIQIENNMLIVLNSNTLTAIQDETVFKSLVSSLNQPDFQRILPLLQDENQLKTEISHAKFAWDRSPFSFYSAKSFQFLYECAKDNQIWTNQKDTMKKVRESMEEIVPEMKSSTDDEFRAKLGKEGHKIVFGSCFIFARDDDEILEYESDAKVEDQKEKIVDEGLQPQVIIAAQDETVWNNFLKGAEMQQTALKCQYFSENMKDPEKFRQIALSREINERVWIQINDILEQNKSEDQWICIGQQEKQKLDDLLHGKYLIKYYPIKLRELLISYQATNNERQNKINENKISTFQQKISELRKFGSELPDFRLVELLEKHQGCIEDVINELCTLE